MTTATPDVVEDTDLADILGHHIPCTEPGMQCQNEATWLLMCTHGHSMVNRKQEGIPATLCDEHHANMEEEIATDTAWVTNLLAAMKVPCPTCGIPLSLPLNWRHL